MTRFVVKNRHKKDDEIELCGQNIRTIVRSSV